MAWNWLERSGREAQRKKGKEREGRGNGERRGESRFEMKEDSERIKSYCPRGFFNTRITESPRRNILEI